MIRLFSHSGRATAPWRKRAGFSLAELLVVIAIMGVLIAVSSPIVSALIINTRLDNAALRLKGTFLQVQGVLMDNINTADRNDTIPRVSGGVYAGVALVVRWDSSKTEYEIFYAEHAQTAKNASNQYLSSQVPAQTGYSRVWALEPLTLGTGMRVVGLRRNDAKVPSRLEIIPDNFAVLINPQATATPFQQTIYVNLPDKASSASATAWNTSGLYNGGDIYSASTPEGFLTSLPMLIVYREEDLSGVTVDVNLDPNVLLLLAHSRVVLLPLQGGAPVDF